MKFDIKINKLSNLYLFISELSQWNELICVPSRKKEWLKQTNYLNPKEKQALKEFSQIFIQASGNPELTFLSEQDKNIWPKITKQIGSKQTQKLKEIFKLFENKFQKIWPSKKEKLAKISKHIKNKQKQIDKKILLICQLCHVKPQSLPAKLDLFLFMNSSTEEAQGWSYQDKIILECSDWPFKKINYLIHCILLHETFHFIIKKNKKIFNLILNSSSQIKKYLPADLKKWDPKIILEDLLISSFLPEGYLTEKFCKINIKKEAKQELKKKNIDNFTKLRNFCALHMYELAKEYTEKEKSLNENYLEELIECIKKAE